MTERESTVNTLIITGPIEQVCDTGEVEVSTAHSKIGAEALEQIMEWPVATIPNSDNAEHHTEPESELLPNPLLDASLDAIEAYISQEIYEPSRRGYRNNHGGWAAKVRNLNGKVVDLGEFLAIDLFKLKSLTSDERLTIINEYSHIASGGSNSRAATPQSTAVKAEPKYERFIDGKSRAAGDRDDD